MLLEAIDHQPKSAYAYAYDQETLHLRIRTKKNDIDRVFVQYGDKYNPKEYCWEVEMDLFATDELFDYYQVEVKPPFLRAAYAFRLEKGKEYFWYTEQGFSKDHPEFPVGHFEFPFINPTDVFSPPEWVKDAIFYQIFPERFANGDPSNDPEDVEPWDGKPTYDNFFGGDLQGVIDKIDYLEELGINAIYFTPIFEASTNHKYDTIDYMKVDPHFGDEKLLKECVERCHEKGIRVVLDAVFNHAGYYFPPFQDVLKKGEKSRYKDWFHIREFPLQTEPIPSYHTFAFTHMMPKFNTEHPEVKEYLLNVARYWIEEIGIDGWRLDVANEVDHHFWREFRKVVKDAKPDAYIIGEIWHEAYPWLMGDQFDAVMNYPVTNAVIDFYCKEKIDAVQFRRNVEKVHARYPLNVNEVNFNLLDSHDTPRLLTMCNGDKGKMKQALTFMFTYLGVPCIYYGDEIGMDGGDDPDCRKPMIWDVEKQDLDLFRFYQQMIAIRKKNRALRDGSFQFLNLKDDEVIGYERKYGNEHLLIFMNRSDDIKTFSTPIDRGKWENLLTKEDLVLKEDLLSLQLKGRETILLRKKPTE